MLCSHPVVYNNQICPCGKCINCRNRKVTEWANRLMLHRRDFKHNCCFVTLTYDNMHLPDDAMLHKKEIQDFMKRLRILLQRKFDGRKISYFLSGEYGSKKFTERPHFHIILFGVGSWFSDYIWECWKKCDKYKAFKCEDLTYQNCKYVAKYSVKQYQHIKIDGKGGVFPEFISMSTRPAIAKNYFINHCEEIMENGYFLINKKKFSVNRYFKDLYKKMNLDGSIYKKTYNFVYDDRIKDVVLKINNYIKDFGNIRIVDFFKCSNVYNELKNKDGDYNINFVEYKDFKKELKGRCQSEKNFCGRFNYKGLDYRKYYDALALKDAVGITKNYMFEKEFKHFIPSYTKEELRQKKRIYKKNLKLVDIDKDYLEFTYYIEKTRYEKNDKILDNLKINYSFFDSINEELHNIHYTRIEEFYNLIIGLFDALPYYVSSEKLF